MSKIFIENLYALNIGLLVLLLIVGLVSGMFGHVSLSPAEFVTALLGAKTDPLTIIVWELRMPRILIGMLVGSTLGYTGAALQGMLRNPLADPGVIGVTASASLGAVIAIYMGFAASFTLVTPIFAMTGALIATLVLLALAARDSSVLTLILAGLGISSLATAAISLVMNYAPTPMALQDMILWMLGSLENRTFEDLQLAAPFILIGWLCMLGVGQGLNALSLGSETAISLGVNLKRLRMQVVVGTALSVGAAVSVTGSIGFVGLVVPHLARAIVGYEPRRILVPSALFGAILITVADVLTRLPIGHGQLRLGVVMAMIGAPLFIYIIFKTRESMR